MNANGTWALAKLTIQYCPVGGSSRGAREFIRTKLVEFAKANPQLAVIAKPKNGTNPVAVGEYQPSNRQKVRSLKNLKPSEILKNCEALRNTTSRKTTARLNKPVMSEKPSIQGAWDFGVTNGVEFNVKEL